MSVVCLRRVVLVPDFLSNQLPIQQLPFPQSPVEGPRRITVGKLVNDLIRLVSPLGKVHVIGEVNNLKWYGSTGFFNLKERSAEISVQIPAHKSKFCQAANGDSVVVTGCVEIQRKNGRLVLVAEQILPVGEGAIALHVAAARERMRADGLLDRPRLTLPMLPQRVVVVCGNDAAVKHDFRTIAAQRFPGFVVTYLEANQGSVESIVDGLKRAQAVAGVDVIVLARGGGDSSALLPYSDEFLCRAIAASWCPVVTAIGHESDHPLCDELSDLRAPTPTAAAMMVIPDHRALRSQLDQSMNRARRAATDKSTTAGLVLQARSKHMAAVPYQRLSEGRLALQRCDVQSVVGLRLFEAHRAVDGAAPADVVTSLLQLRQSELRVVAVRLRPPERGPLSYQLTSLINRVGAAHPQQMLHRGYAVVRSTSGQVVRSAEEVSVGETLEITLAGGTLSVTVNRSTSAERHHDEL
jgi:exodeoxyribonuclease VII large subunit